MVVKDDVEVVLVVVCDSVEVLVQSSLSSSSQSESSRLSNRQSLSPSLPWIDIFLYCQTAALDFGFPGVKSKSLRIEATENFQRRSSGNGMSLDAPKKAGNKCGYKEHKFLSMRMIIRQIDHDPCADRYHKVNRIHIWQVDIMPAHKKSR